MRQLKAVWNWIKKKFKLFIKNQKDCYINDANNASDKDETILFDNTVGTILKEIFTNENQETRKEYETIKVQYKIKEKEFNLEVKKELAKANDEKEQKMLANKKVLENNNKAKEQKIINSQEYLENEIDNVKL